MTRMTRMLGIALVASTALSTAAVAQREGGYRAPATPPQTPQPRGEQEQSKASKGGATVMIGSKKVSLSAEFAKTYNELIKALEANASADVSAQVAAAHAAAKSPEEHYLA